MSADNFNQNALRLLVGHARRLALAPTRPAQWAVISQCLEQAFGHRLFTTLLYLPDHRLMKRLYTSSEAISPLGGYKATGSGPWSSHVLERGLIHVAADEAEVRTIFSEADMLIGHGLCSALNLPVRYEGRVIGSLNLLAQAHAYDRADHDLGELIASLCVSVFLQELHAAQSDVDSVDRSLLDSV